MIWFLLGFFAGIIFTLIVLAIMTYYVDWTIRSRRGWFGEKK